MEHEFELFYQSLVKQLKFFQALLLLTKKEKKCLLGNDLKAINDVLKEKENIFNGLKESENERNYHRSKLAECLGDNSLKVTMTRLIGLIDKNRAYQLQKIKRDVEDVVKELKNEQRKNELISQYMLGHTQGMIKIYLAFGAKDRGYSKKGVVEKEDAVIYDRLA